MNTKKLLVVLAGLLLLTSGCGEWVQDPLGGKDKRFRGGTSVPTKPDLTKPVPSDAVNIQAPLLVTFKENTEYEFEIFSRVLLEDYEVEVAFKNIELFPGATYDPQSGQFKWRPPVGYVESNSIGEVEAELPLEIEAIATKPDGQVLMKSHTVVMRVRRDFLEPVIVRVDSPRNWLREGETVGISVTVFDKEANARDASTWPKVLFSPVSNNKNLAGLASYTRSDSFGNNEYRISFQVNARETELTNAVDTYKLRMIAFSQHGKQSAAWEWALDIYTQLPNPISTWTSTFEAKAEDVINHRFYIVDPKQEGWLTLDRTVRLPNGSTIDCQSAGRGILSCAFAWMPGEDSVGDHRFTLMIRSRNDDSRDTNQPVRNLAFEINVLPKGN